MKPGVLSAIWPKILRKSLGVFSLAGGFDKIELCLTIGLAVFPKFVTCCGRVLGARFSHSGTDGFGHGDLDTADANRRSL